MPLLTELPRAKVSLLKNSFMPLSSPYSSAESTVFGQFERDSGLSIDSAATFSTAWVLLGIAVNREPYIGPISGSDSIPGSDFVPGIISGCIPPHSASPNTTTPPAIIKTPAACPIR